MMIHLHKSLSKVNADIWHLEGILGETQRTLDRKRLERNRLIDQIESGEEMISRAVSVPVRSAGLRLPFPYQSLRIVRRREKLRRRGKKYTPHLGVDVLSLLSGKDRRESSDS